MLHRVYKLASLRSCTYIRQGTTRHLATSGAHCFSGPREASSSSRPAKSQANLPTAQSRFTRRLYNLRDYSTGTIAATADSSGSTAPKMSDAVLMNDDGPLIWIDCEMTGLNPDTDRLLEIAVIITDGRLKPAHEGIEYIIQTPKEVLDQMDEWCTTTHGESGLTQSCIDSPHTLEHVSEEVLKYVKKYVPERGAGLLAGSSVHADMRFLYKQMPGLLRHLSYRILDVSSVKEICKRWYPSVREKERDSRTGKIAHRALDDIQASIRELRFYQEHIFKPLEPPPMPSDKSTSGEEAKLIETFNKAL